MLREISILDKDATLTISSDRNRLRPWGVFGGKPASPAACRLSDANGTPLKLKPKDTRGVCRGDTVVTMTSGGGGWGDPFEREPQRVQWDVIEGLVSIERARSEYGVALAGPDLEIDPAETQRHRSGSPSMAAKG